MRLMHYLKLPCDLNKFFLKKNFNSEYNYNAQIKVVMNEI